ncbi:putative Polycomb group protein ASXL2 isoform X2 [Colossoma macropomum]|uniref:putative Polycomb group protein ASXL2 isoform X2 n=1 Tax=Colossoma macropomum TaxID=42526 RepID=UPI001863FE0A|nr:putative Polycomb group protein ASXL2 isoform X2 [Colossoma macropomum]
MRERQKKKKGRTWAEAAKTVLEKYPNTPMSHKEILQVIQRERLKEISGTSPLACLNAMLHTNSRGEEGIFYKVPGRMGVYTLKKDIADVVKELSEEASEDSSDNTSDARSTENNNSASSKEGRRGRWKRRGPAKLQSQPSSPQSRCSSPSVSSNKLISSSQKHSKKALKQALKQQQQRNQRRQCGISTASNPRLLLKTVKDMTDSASAKSAMKYPDSLTTVGWELKQSERCPASPQNSTSSSSSSVKADVCHTVGARKMSQRSSRLSARQLRRTKCEIDVETPDSILVNTNLRALINKHTFSMLPPDCQQKLLKLLPEIDQQSCMDGLLRVTSSALNNEFFTSAAQSWKERLAEGEFTPELRLRIRQEIEKEKKVEHWKEHFFESYYGEQSGLSVEESRELTQVEGTSVPAKDLTLSGGSESRTEAQKPSHTAEVSQKEQRSTEVKSTVPISHVESESFCTGSIIASHSTSDQTLTSPDTKTALLAQEESEATALKEEPLTSAATDENVQVSETKSDAPKPHQEAVSISPKGKDALETESVKVDGTVSPTSAVTTESLKRKVSSEQETAEKKPRLSPPEGLPQAIASVTVQQRVPPLKIPVSRILPAPPAAGQVSPRTPHPLTPPSIRPGGTGARTLADIKAKAKLAREQRAAAAAAAAGAATRGATSGPGSTGGTSTPSPARSLSEEFSPASSRSQSVSPVKISSVSPAPESTGFLSQTSPSSGATGQTDSGFAQSLCANQLFLKENRSLMGSQTTQCASDPLSKDHHTLLAVGGMQLPPLNTLAHNQRAQEAPLSGTKSHSSIPANNPLVTQLLQGKEVPLEKILPKPLAKTEVQSVTTPAQDHGKLGITTKGLGRENSIDTEDVSRSRLQASSGQSMMSGRPGISMDKLDKITQEQIIHVLRHRSQQSQISVSVPQPSHFEPYQLGYPESCNNQPRFHLGLFGRKRVAKPAMTGHYLLNISTYGRGSESSKRPHLANLKRENVEGEEKEGADLSRGAHSSSGHSNPPRVKVEQQGYLISRPDDALGYQHCPQIKLESPALSCSSSTGEGGTSTKTKDTSPRPHLDVCSSKQGISGPHQLSECHPQVKSFQSQNSNDGQEPVMGTFYGGTISMSVPPSLNNSIANTGTSPTVTCSRESANGGMMSFSVTVTAIPAGHLLDQSKGEASPEQAFIEASGMEDVQSKCYCRLKAMIMCKGCGAFCHDDCIGPSKLCVSCLVVR